jgi:hypothetical protein
MSPGGQGLEMLQRRIPPAPQHTPFYDLAPKVALAHCHIDLIRRVFYSETDWIGIIIDLGNEPDATLGLYRWKRHHVFISAAITL